MSEKVHEAIKEIDELKKKIYERSSNMASTNKTTNYELSQFVETDKPGWLTDYNSDMRIIDSNLKSVSDVASGASGSLSALTDRVTAAEGAITTNANDIDALEARADVLEAQAQSMSGTIANIQTEQITQNAGIEAATELGYNLARPYDSASTYAVGDYVLFQNTLYKCITAVPVGEAFVPAKWLAIKATDEISAGGYTLPIASANTLGGVKVGSNLSIDANGALSGPAPYSLPIASANDLGGVKVGSGLSIDALTGVLSADGSNDNLVVLDSSNTSLSFDSSNPPFCQESQNFFYGTHATGTLTNLTNLGIYLTSGEQSFYYESGDLKLLKLALSLTFGHVVTQNNNVMDFQFRFKLQNANIHTPPNDTYAFCHVGAYNPLEQILFYDSVNRNYVFATSLYRPQGGVYISDIVLRAIFIFH